MLCEQQCLNLASNYIISFLKGFFWQPAPYGMRLLCLEERRDERLLAPPKTLPKTEMLNHVDARPHYDCKIQPQFGFISPQPRSIHVLSFKTIYLVVVEIRVVNDTTDTIRLSDFYRILSYRIVIIVYYRFT